MTGLFVGLKLRLLRNGLRLSTARQVAYALGAVIGVCYALAGAGLLAVSARYPGSGPAVVLSFVAVAAAWTLLPVLYFGLDETLDPARLALLPLTRRQLIAGLLAASAVGIVPGAFALVLLGSLGYSRSVPAAGLVLLDAATMLLLCLALARATTSALSSRLRTRRGKDAVAVFLPLLAVSYYAVRLLAVRIVRSAGPHGLHRLASVARWTPAGMLGHALLDVRAGRDGVALAQIGGGLTAVLALLWWWSRSLESSLTTADVNAPSRPRPGRGPGRFARASGRFAGPVGAVVGKELRCLRRDPRRKTGLISALAVGTVMPIYFTAGSPGAGHALVFAVLGPVGFTGLTAMNALGYDGQAIWTDVVAARGWRAVLLGKAVALAVMLLPALAVLGVALAAVSAGWRLLPAALLAAAALLVTLLGASAAVSVRVPIPLPAEVALFHRGGAGSGLLAALVGLGALAGSGLLLAPGGALLFAGLHRWAPGLVLGPIALVATAAAAFALGLRSGARYADAHPSELLAALAPKEL